MTFGCSLQRSEGVQVSRPSCTFVPHLRRRLEAVCKLCTSQGLLPHAMASNEPPPDVLWALRVMRQLKAGRAHTLSSHLGDGVFIGWTARASGVLLIPPRINSLPRLRRHPRLAPRAALLVSHPRRRRSWLSKLCVRSRESRSLSSGRPPLVSAIVDSYGKNQAETRATRCAAREREPVSRHVLRDASKPAEFFAAKTR